MQRILLPGASSRTDLTQEGWLGLGGVVVVWFGQEREEAGKERRKEERGRGGSRPGLPAEGWWWQGVAGGEKERREVEFGWEEREKPKEEGGFSLRVGERGERETCGGLWCCHAGGGWCGAPLCCHVAEGEGERGKEGEKERVRAGIGFRRAIRSQFRSFY